jgi:O-methyltransferase
MLRELQKLLTRPRKYIPVLATVPLQKICWLFQNRSFFLQGQMDIHPNARWRSDLVAATGGFYPPNDPTARTVCNLDAHDNTRRDMLVLLLRTVIEKQVPGAFAELGVYQGLTARLMHHYAPERPLHLFDTFQGFTPRASLSEMRNTGEEVPPSQFSDTSLERVKRFIRQRNDNVHFHPGYFPESIPKQLHAETFAFVHLDADLFEPTWAGLTFFYPRVSPRGIIVIHDYNSWPGARKAVDTFFADKAELPIPMPDKSGSALVVKRE